MANSIATASTGSNDGENHLLPEYYEKKYQDTLEEWEKFIAGNFGIDSAIIPREVQDSWVRCQELGLDPLARPQHEILEGDNLLTLLKENEHFINVSRIFMNHLYGFMSGSRFTVTLFDRQGYLLEIMVRDEFKAIIRKANWMVGALWDEPAVGNNAVGTVLTLRKPIRIFGPQHYNKTYHRDTISSAPIYDPEGEFIGGITVTGYYYATTMHTLGLAVAAAKAIENQLFIQKAMTDAQVASSYQKTVIASIPEALITTDNRGCISLLNDNARKLFHLEGRQVEGESIAAVFGEGNRQFLSLIDSDETVADVEVRIFAGDAANEYTLSSHPIHSPGGETLGKILILTEIKKVKTLITKMIGAKANFQFEDIYGRSSKFVKTLDQARIVARSNSNALLLGKSGTGKDIFAQAIHNASSRKNGPYVAINCAAIPRDLITSEFFGYSEGAFTGSRRGGSHGKFELADGGTIFLDEIAETPLELQGVLLRVIEDKSVIRIGGQRVRPVDVRVIAATNKDLREEVRKGNFREDLYYRLNVFAIFLVPLSERHEDIPILLDCFINKYGGILGKRIDRIDPKVLELFLRYPWPGNIRELQNVVERMMNFTRTGELTTEFIPSEILDFRAAPGSGEDAGPMERKENLETSPQIPKMDSYGLFRKNAEQDMIAQMLEMGIKKKQIAQKLSISRMTVYRKMKKYNLN